MPKFVDPNEEIEFLESEIIIDDDDEDIPIGELVVREPVDAPIEAKAEEDSLEDVSPEIVDVFMTTAPTVDNVEIESAYERQIAQPAEEKVEQPVATPAYVPQPVAAPVYVVEQKQANAEIASPASSNGVVIAPINEEDEEEVEEDVKPTSLNDSDIWGLAKIDVKKPTIKKEEKQNPAEVKEEVKAEPKKSTKKAVEKKDVPPTESGEKKVVGKFVIEQNEDIYLFCLYANNGQLLYESREYASLATCKGGIETFKKNVAVCDYRIAQDKNGNWKYIFRKGNSIYIGESYKSEQSATNSAESTKRFAAISEIAD